MNCSPKGPNYSHSSQTDGKALLLKITPTQIIYHGDIDVVPHHFQVYWPLFLVLGGTLHTNKEKGNTNVVTKHLTYNGGLTVGILVQLMMEKNWGAYSTNILIDLRPSTGDGSHTCHYFETISRT